MVLSWPWQLQAVWCWLGGRGCACACLCVWSARCFLGVQALLLVGSCLQEGSERIPPRGAGSPPPCRRSSPAAGLFRQSAVTFPSGPLSGHQPLPGAPLPSSQLCVTTQSCFGRAVVALLCLAAVPWLAKPTCPVSLPARSPSHPGWLSPLPVPGPYLLFVCRGTSRAAWAAGTLLPCPDPTRVCPVAAKFQNLWAFRGSDFLRSSPWRDMACGKLPVE